jgi:xylulokinase
LDVERRIPTFPFVVPGFWDLEGVVSTAGAALRWVRELFFPTSDYSALDKLAGQSPPGSSGVRFYPHLTGATSPLWKANTRGAFTGLHLATDRGDIVRSVLEGIAFQIRANLEVMETMTRVEELVLFGGGAKSKLWSDIICQVAGKPVYVTDTVDVANWGACILAGVGIGLYDDPMAANLPTDLLLSSTPSTQTVSEYDAICQEYLETEMSLVGGK